MHTFGVTHKPEVITVDLGEAGAKLANLTLILASDGIWDLWEYEDVFQGIVCPATCASGAQTRVGRLAQTCIRAAFPPFLLRVTRYLRCLFWQARRPAA